jgi:hypothetical protein
LIEIIDAEIKIKTEVSGLQVWAINAEGTLHGLIPSQYADGVLSFRVGVTTPSMYYLIQKA